MQRAPHTSAGEDNDNGGAGAWKRRDKKEEGKKNGLYTSQPNRRRRRRPPMAEPHWFPPRRCNKPLRRSKPLRAATPSCPPCPTATAEKIRHGVLATAVPIRAPMRHPASNSARCVTIHDGALPLRNPSSKPRSPSPPLRKMETAMTRTPSLNLVNEPAQGVAGPTPPLAWASSVSRGPSRLQKHLLRRPVDIDNTSGTRETTQDATLHHKSCALVSACFDRPIAKPLTEQRSEHMGTTVRPHGRLRPVPGRKNAIRPPSLKVASKKTCGPKPGAPRHLQRRRSGPPCPDIHRSTPQHLPRLLRSRQPSMGVALGRAGNPG